MIVGCEVDNDYIVMLSAILLIDPSLAIPFAPVFLSAQFVPGDNEHVQ